ncbi:hypothetical protein COT94_03215 [Candidatus Falkowbacteria bacterium CG10_big_fil_rev_8_21_14_0_10_37_14]|uniref:PrgI family protein n=1 Tax=Candidatus Falkowbacteria bacterium CG10_big_fil_rev_8_21_14_0_10_37_14 TaxID=1974561 RepID=A0A2M6WSY7_9BACT|nr:PrgI family protein [Candidatus Falkowbacteria bacterium]PIT95919.1 MAG: hypothetical protein COT94_03215 [Candidatus Falkowbacteria bacterium CG10_big_fil_rev_8_21_14_0_10_37_14]
MQQFTVPQFIDVEAKIVGPLSIRQFLVLMVGGIFVVIFYRIFDFSLFLVSAILTIMLAAIFAFTKIRGMDFHYFLLCFIQTTGKPMIRTWNRVPEMDNHDDLIPPSGRSNNSPRRFTTSHLNKLSLIVDTKGYYSSEDAGSDINVYRKGQEPEDMLIG